MMSKQLLDSQIANKKQVLYDLYNDLQAYSQKKSLEPNQLAQLEQLKTSQDVQTLVKEQEKAIDASAESFEKYKVLQAQKKIVKIGTNESNFDFASTMSTIERLATDIKRLSKESVMNKDIIRELSVKL